MRMLVFLSPLVIVACTHTAQTVERDRGEQLPLAPQAGPGSTALQEALTLEAAGLVEQKIVGGRDALPGENPWQVALVAGSRTDKNIIFCGGSLIGARWVLTAAHCVDGGTVPGQVDVVSGTVDLDAGGHRSRVTQIIVHPSWDPSTHNDDLALLKLADTGTGQPIELVTPIVEPQLLPPGGILRVTGWGRTQQMGQTVRKLRDAEPPFVSQKDCNNRTSYNGAISDLMLCAGRQFGGVDSCQGDSGGPLSAPANGRRILVGIVSWGEGCAKPNKYGVYTRVSRFTGWIQRCIGNNDCRAV